MTFMQIDGNAWTDEGLRHGDLLEVEPPAEPFEGKLVVAQLTRNERIFVRRFRQAGTMIEFTPMEGTSPAFRIPQEDVTILHLVKTHTRRFE